MLSLGLKFIIRPPPSTLNELKQSYHNFIRLLRIKNQMLGSNDCVSSGNTFRVPNKNFTPSTGGKALENYITNVNANLLAAYDSLPLAIKRNQKIPKMFKVTIQKLKSDSTIQICSADKNLGICIVDRDWYENEALRQLTDKNTYMKVRNLPNISHFTTAINNILRKYNKQNSTIAKYFLQTMDTDCTKNTFHNKNNEPKLSRFYLTIKIHKKPLIGRPIVSSEDTVTYFISKFLDKTLQPVMKNLPTYLRNTDDLIVDIETNTQLHNMNNQHTIYTADIKDMYPSINIKDGLTKLQIAIEEYNSKIDNSKMIQTQFIIELAHFVLTNNYFKFGKDTYWLQISGTAMGTPLAVTFACIYIGQLEKETFETLSLKNALPYYYKRYIDDIFAIFKNEEDKNLFHLTFNNLRPGKIQLLPTNTGRSSIFMDLNITLNTDNRIDIKIYQKPQNSYLYLPPSSFHQRHVFGNTIIAELNRYKLKCTYAYDYEELKQLFYTRLIARGYKTEYLQTIFQQVTNITRKDLIHKVILKLNISNTKNTNAPVVFVTTNTSLTRYLNLSNVIKPTEELDSSPLCQLLFPRHKGSHKPIIAYKRTSNMREVLTKSTYNYPLG